MVQQNAAEKVPPGKEREADAKSSSHLSTQPRPAQAHRRSWRRRAQDLGSQKGKPIRLNRVPLLRAEASSRSAATQEVAGLSRAVGPATSSKSSLPCRKQALKRGHPPGATEPQTPESPLAKRRRMDDVPAQSAGTSSSGQVASRLFQDSQSSRSQAYTYRPPWVLPRSQPGPIRMRHVWREQLREKKPYSRPENQSRTRRASTPGARPPYPSK